MKEIESINQLSLSSHLPVCQLHGHTHVPNMFTLDQPPEPEQQYHPCCCQVGKSYPLGKHLTLANPGSVGQPRNKDQRACYAILDTSNRTITFYRVTYELKDVRRTMAKNGYPGDLIYRLDNPEIGDKYLDNFWRECLETQKQATEI